MRKLHVFYSWQSDLPNATNRGFIQKALEKAAKSIREDDSIEVEPVIDRDTAGVPGSPDIAAAIFGKIDQAHVFVCDVSIINKGTKKFRKAPNPNVLVELGYARKTLGQERILMVMNTAFGKPETLPFDLNKKRVVSYHMPDKCEDRSDERNALESKFDHGLRAILAQIKRTQAKEVAQTQSVADEARMAVENAQPNQVVLVRKFTSWLVEQLDALSPDFSKEVEPDDSLVESINQTVELMADFARLAESIAIMSASEPAFTLCRSFDQILKHYYVPRGFSGMIPQDDFDFYRFAGHELFTTLVSFLLRENRWELIADILDERIYIDNAETGQAGIVSFQYISKPVGLLSHRNERLELNRASLHADILKERHSGGVLNGLVPIQQFMWADYFLFLRAQFEKTDSDRSVAWKPWSTIFLQALPPYIERATRKKYAQKLLRPFGIESIDTFRSKLVEVKVSQNMARVFGDPFWLRIHDPLSSFNPQSIGTR